MNNLTIKTFLFASFKKRLSNKCHKISKLYHIHYYPFPTNCPSKLLIDYYLISNGHWKQTEHRLTRTRWGHKPTKCAADQCWSSVFVFFRFFPFRSSYDHPPKKPKGTRSVSYTVSSPIGLASAICGFRSRKANIYRGGHSQDSKGTFICFDGDIGIDLSYSH